MTDESRSGTGMISVFIPAHDAASTLPAQLAALARASAPARAVEVVVADDGSTDATGSVAARAVPGLDVRLVRVVGTHGANAARNAGIRASRGELIVLCDADDEVDEGWLRAFESGFDAGHALMAGPIDYRRLNPPDVVAWRGSTGSFLTRPLGFLPSAHGASLAFRREVVDAVGGFDEEFVAGGTDAEFLWRAQQAGFPLEPIPDALVHYRLRPSLRQHWRQWVTYGAAEAHLYRAFAGTGVSRRPPATVLHEVWWLATRLPFAVGRQRRGAWLRRLAAQWGRLVGALRYRVLWW